MEPKTRKHPTILLTRFKSSALSLAANKHYYFGAAGIAVLLVSAILACEGFTAGKPALGDLGRNTQKTVPKNEAEGG